MNKKINEVLFEKRTELCWTRKQLSEKSGVCINTIYNIEKERINANIATLNKLCDALEIHMSDLFD